MSNQLISKQSIIEWLDEKIIELGDTTDSRTIGKRSAFLTVETFIESLPSSQPPQIVERGNEKISDKQLKSASFTSYNENPNIDSSEQHIYREGFERGVKWVENNCLSATPSSSPKEGEGMIKTAEEVLKESGVLMVDFMSSSTHEAVLQAMEEYANQFKK
jgi:hypothetical protein